MSLANRPKQSIKNPNLSRSIPRNSRANNRAPIDGILKYMYKYSFHQNCLAYKVISSEGKVIANIKTKDFLGYSAILELMNILYNETVIVADGKEKYAGVPIAPEGFICHYNSDDLDDQTFTVTIKLADLGDINKHTAQNVNSVTYHGK